MKDKMEFPYDVQKIIEYTKLRKKYPALDKALRNNKGYKEINFEQMEKLMEKLKEHENELRTMRKKV